MMTFDTSTLVRATSRTDRLLPEQTKSPDEAAAPRRSGLRDAVLIATVALLAGVGIGMLLAPAPLPKDLLRLAHETRAGGLFEIEVDANGRIFGSAAEIELESVPRICREAADRAVPMGRSMRAEKQTIGSDSYYEIEKDVDGVAVELLINAKGEVVGREDEIAPDDAPASVLSRAHAALPGGRIVSVERVQGPEARGTREFHVKKTVQGEVYRIRVGDGPVEVLRSIRTALKAER